MSTDEFDGDGDRAMDDALSAAGSAWRAGQPASGAIDPALFRRSADRRRSGWTAALVAAAVALIAVGVVTAVEVSRTDRVAPPVAAATSTITVVSSAATSTLAPEEAADGASIVCTVRTGVDGAPVTVTLPASPAGPAGEVPSPTMHMTTLPMSGMRMTWTGGSGMHSKMTVPPTTASSVDPSAGGGKVPACAELGYAVTVTGCFGWTATLPSDCADPCPGGVEMTWGVETTGTDGEPSANAGGYGSCPAPPETVASAVGPTGGPQLPNTVVASTGSVLPVPPSTVPPSTVPTG